MPERDFFLHTIRCVLVCCMMALCSACSRVEPLLLSDQSVNLVWPQPPDPPRIKYLCDIKGPEDIYPEKSDFQKLSEMVTGDNRTILELLTPYSVATDSKGIIYIADTSMGVVHRYDLVDRDVSYISKAGGDQLASPVAVALDRNDNLYIADSLLNKVFKFRKDGEFIKELVSPVGFKRPGGIAISTVGEIFVVDALANILHKFNANDVYEGTFPASLPGEGLNTPSFVATDRSGNVYVTDAMNFTVKKYGADGKLIKRIGEVGDVPGTFSRPKGVALDSDGHVYVVDANHNNFQIFNGEGQLLLFVGVNGDRPGEFSLPSGIFIDNQDRIFIADTFNRRIQVFQYLRAGGKHE